MKPSIERDFKKVEKALEKAAKSNIVQNPSKAFGLLIDAMTKRYSFYKTHVLEPRYQEYLQKIENTLEFLSNKYNPGIEK